MKASPPLPSATDGMRDAVETALGFWDCCANVAELWWSRHGGIAPGAAAAQRLRELIGFAREASPFYGRLYAHLPASPALRELPVVTKARLMASFDDWATDRRLRRSEVERFLADRTRIGQAYLGRYHVWKSSGTSGTPGIFIQDGHAMAVYDALLAAQFDAAALGQPASAPLWAGGARAALVVATGDHFASITSWQHLARGYAGMARRSFSVLEPTARLVEQLNDYRPAFLASYPSVLSLLAAERTAGRLAIAPALLWSGGEFLGEPARATIEKTFGCRVMNEYGASECLSIAFGCPEGWLHLNSEWVILEGVDERARPAPPGELSHSSLLTNLANWAQPIIRYELGDRVVAKPTPCACGNPLPAIRVEGRTDATVQMKTASGAPVHIVPLALATVVEDAAGEHRFQIAQTAPDHLTVRFDSTGGTTRARIWRRASRALKAYLASQSLPDVRITLDPAPPHIDARSGKLHAVTVEPRCRPRPRD